MHSGFPRGSFRATVLIETLPAAFQMDEILFELREHSYGLNAGRWDYIFSMIKSFRERPEFVLPDRNDVTMTVPFMASYAQLLVKTCHRRGAFAMGGMAALIPSRTDPEANQRAIDAVAADKEREAGLGFDGTWVAHPDVVAVAREAFDAVLGDRPNQIERRRDDVSVDAADLLDAAATSGAITEAGLRNNINVGVPVHLVLARWARRRRDQQPDGGRRDRRDLPLADLAVDPPRRPPHGRADRHPRARARDARRGDATGSAPRSAKATWEAGRPRETRQIFERVALADDFPEFLTLPAYELLD